MAFRSGALDPARHDLGPLNSGEPELDVWLQEQAAGAEARRVARSFVWVDTEANPDLVIGYSA